MKVYLDAIRFDTPTSKVWSPNDYTAQRVVVSLCKRVKLLAISTNRNLFGRPFDFLIALASVM